MGLIPSWYFINLISNYAFHSILTMDQKLKLIVFHFSILIGILMLIAFVYMYLKLISFLASVKSLDEQLKDSSNYSE